MKNIQLNFRKHTIEITKAFEKKASTFNSSEYKELVKARKDYPDYRVVVVAGAKSRPDNYKGLTYEFMKKYMEAKQDNEGLERLKQIRVMKNNKLSLDKTPSFLETRKWFLEKYPELQVKKENA